MDGPDVARLLADKYGGHHHYLRAPVLVEQSTLRDMLYAEPAISHGIQKARNVKLAITGVGTVEEEASSFLRTGNLTREELAQLRSMGLVGETCGRFFDAWGRYEGYEINKRIIGIDLKDLGNVPRVIAVARGLPKARSILGALRGRLMTVLATDDKTAQAILEIDNSDHQKVVARSDAAQPPLRSTRS